jgi:hypothetical protein
VGLEFPLGELFQKWGATMSRLVLDSKVRAVLQNAIDVVEICDEAGVVVGQYIPIIDSGKHTKLEPQITLDEIERRERQGGGRGLQVILADLERGE